MAKKRRVYELAKDYGMKGPAFVQVLEDLGFDRVKTHMAVLDDADQMVIEVRLGAAGFDKTTDLARPVKKAVVRKKPIRRKAASGDSTTAVAEEEATAQTTASPIRRKAALRAAPEAWAPDAPPGGDETPPPEATPATEAPDEEAPAETAPEPTEDLPETIDIDLVAAPPALTRIPATAPPANAVAQAVDPIDPSAPPADSDAPALDGPEVADESAATDLDPKDESDPGTKAIRRLPQPVRKAKILGRIELPKQTIDDATRRSAPSGPRNPASVDRNLRQAAMQQFRARGAHTMPQRRGPFARRGPGRPGGGGRRQKADPLAPPPGIDPDKLVQVEAPVSVKKLSEALGHKVQQILVVMMNLGEPVNINTYLDKSQVELVALELHRNVEVVEATEAEDELLSQLTEAKDAILEEDKSSRAPIVSFMGHVDHGKTTLLDALRGSEITKSEAGGITQHTAAYKITRNNRTVIVLDTPGHAAFTEMRARGAQLTDIVVLVVAADDGVMPQTEEALNHVKAASVPLVIAVNKCDKVDANPMRVRQQLSTLGVQPEEWGGDVQFIDISALKGNGVDELLEKIVLEAEILELRSTPDHAASGNVIEAKQTPAQGNVISLMVMDGTLKRGDLVLCGSGTGRIRVLLDDSGNRIETAAPGTPVEVIGLPELPQPGDKFFVVTDTKMAKQVAGQRATKQRHLDLARKSKGRAADMTAQLLNKKKEEVRLIIKADVMGSLEPIRQSLEALTHDEVAVRILHSALGGVTETDVTLADASNAIIVGFNSVPDEKARAKADEAGVTIRFYNIIYELIDDARKLLEGLLSPEQKEEIRGHAEIRAVFHSSKLGNIAGCLVTDGTISRNNAVRLSRDGKVIYTGKFAGLRREKDDVREVRKDFECGILIQGYNDIKEGDIIEAYQVIEVKRTLGEDD